MAVKKNVEKEKDVKGALVLPKVEVAKEVKAIINRIRKRIESVGKSSKEICKDMALIEDKDNKYVIKELGLSKATISQMKSAGRIYNSFAFLDCMAHTNIVELSPLFKEGYDKKVLDEFVDYVFPARKWNGDEEKGNALSGLSQRSLREAVKDFICPVVTGVELKGEGEGEGEGEGVGKEKKDVKKTDSFKELEKLLKKYKVSKEDMEKVNELVEAIVNEAM